MSMSDPIADMLTRIRNAQARGKKVVVMGATKAKLAVAEVLKSEGYISEVTVEGDGPNRQLSIVLKYYGGRPVINRLVRVSRPGLRVYRGHDELPRVMGGMGVAVVSTSRGVMSDKAARSIGEGGEVICLVD